MGTKPNTNNIFFLVPIKTKKIATISNVEIIENNTMSSVQELCLHLFSTQLNSIEFISASPVSSILSTQSSINLFTNLFLHLKFL